MKEFMTINYCSKQYKCIGKRKCKHKSNFNYDTIVETTNLCKSYKDNVVLNNVSLEVKKGDIYGLIGQNGAGKTTLIRIILSLIKESSGSVTLFGSNCEKSKTHEITRIGSIVETPSFYSYLTAKQNLEYYRIQKGIAERKIVDEVLDLVKLTNHKDKKFKNFSLGMKQRLGLALSLLGNPDLLILDEPINGLDPLGIKEIREILLNLNKTKGTTIIISSHILEELHQLATCYGFIHKGKLIEEISLSNLNAKCKNYLSIIVDSVEKAAFVLEQKLNTDKYLVYPNNEIRLYDYLNKSNIVNKTLISNNVDVFSISNKGLNLEEYFLELIGGDGNV